VVDVRRNAGSVASELRKQLPQDVALLQYLVLPKHLLIVVVRSDGVFFAVQPIDENELRTTALDFISAIGSEAGHPRTLRLAKPHAVTRSAAETGRLLYSSLIEPVRDHLSGIKTLGILPHSFIYVLPFAALQAPDGRYVSEDRSISGV